LPNETLLKKQNPTHFLENFPQEYFEKIHTFSRVKADLLLMKKKKQ